LRAGSYEHLLEGGYFSALGYSRASVLGLMRALALAVLRAGSSEHLLKGRYFSELGYLRTPVTWSLGGFSTWCLEGRQFCALEY